MRNLATALMLGVSVTLAGCGSTGGTSTGGAALVSTETSSSHASKEIKQPGTTKSKASSRYNEGQSWVYWIARKIYCSASGACATPRCSRIVPHLRRSEIREGYHIYQSKPNSLDVLEQKLQGDFLAWDEMPTWSLDAEILTKKRELEISMVVKGIVLQALDKTGTKDRITQGVESRLDCKL
ncbi:MAG: hypothetical protein ABL901_10125 [Hyphomicrobiaceae bacterium]